MNDNEIIKALENCMTPNNACGDCSLRKECDNNTRTLENYALALINRQKAEIETLKTNNNSLCITLHNRARVERTEAIKEFAERLKGLPSVTNCEYEWFHLDIDNLLKEMESD